MSSNPFLDDSDHLPVGRHSLSWDDAEALLVTNSLFAGSTRRPILWAGLTRYIARFDLLAEKYEDVLAGVPLVHFIWIGGSFASKKLEPNQMDISIAVDQSGRRALAGKPGAGWFAHATSREKCVKDFGVSPLDIPYVVIPSPFRSGTLSSDDQNYLRERGAWDDWWQRMRTEGQEDCPPTAQTAMPVRGYLEVTL